MAASLEERHRSLELKSTRSPKTKSSSLKHKSRIPTDTFRKSEQSLRELLEDFETGRLNAFGNSDMLQKMNDIREMQEKLTLKHFEIDQMKINQDSSSGAPTGSRSNCDEQEDASLTELTQGLEKLGAAIQSLHSDTSLILARGDRKPVKRVSLRPGSVIEEIV